MPESAIWNVDLDQKGRIMHVLRMETVRESSPHYRADLSAAPSVAEIEAWSKPRAARRRAGHLPTPPSGELNVASRSPGALSKSHTTYDTALPGHTHFEGPGKKVTDRSEMATDIKQVMGFFLYVHSDHNVKWSDEAKLYVKEYAWPAPNFLQRRQGVPPDTCYL